MGLFTPIQTALLIGLTVAAVGFIIVMVRKQRTFAGYSELRETANELRKLLRGEIFRDGDDLVISGNHKKLPAVVRFSYAETTPGLNIRMEAPATFNMSITPRASNLGEGKVVVRTADDKFDTRFVVRSDHPTQAKMFVGGKLALAHLQKLCCSGNTFFTVSTRSLELSELAIPAHTTKHVLDHMDSMLFLARALADMPGAHAIKITEIAKERSIPIRAAIAVGTVAAVIAVVAATRATRDPVDAAVLQLEPGPPAGILPLDAQLMRNLAGWEMALEEDVDPSALTWLRSRGRQFTGRIEGDFSGSGARDDVAYVLVREDSTRVAIIAGRQNAFDATYENVHIVTRVSANAFAATEWKGTPPSPAQGDALLLVRGAETPEGLVLYLQGERIVSAYPVDFRNMPLD